MNDQTTPPRKLLVVDDDRELADSLVRALETAGYSAAAAYNAEDAVSFVSNGAPDLVVLDIRMPGLSGIKLSELLKQQFAVPFVFLSVANDDDTVRQATAVGALAYLVKPMDMRQCIPAISAALARADDVNALRKNESQLAAAIEQTRMTSVVVGLLMERLRVDRETAFHTLRAEARSQRRRIHELAEDLLLAAERLNRLSSVQPRNKGRAD